MQRLNIIRKFSSWQQVLCYKYQYQNRYLRFKYQYKYRYFAFKYKYQYQYSKNVLKYNLSTSTSTSTKYNKTGKRDDLHCLMDISNAVSLLPLFCHPIAAMTAVCEIFNLLHFRSTAQGGGGVAQVAQW